MEDRARKGRKEQERMEMFFKKKVRNREVARKRKLDSTDDEEETETEKEESVQEETEGEKRRDLKPSAPKMKKYKIPKLKTHQEFQRYILQFCNFT